MTEKSISNSKLLGLELIRIISAFAVLISHYAHFSEGPCKILTIEHQHLPFYNIFWVFYTYGFYGVHVFWAVSGYIFFTKYSHKIENKIISAKEFFILRFSRLYPLHFATLILITLVQMLYFAKNKIFFMYIVDFKHFLSHLFMASNWFVRTWSFNAPIWSVSVEVLVYCFFFITLRFFQTKWIWHFIGLFILLSELILKSNAPFFNCVLYFYLGAFASTLSEWKKSEDELLKLRINYSLIFFLVSMTLICLYKVKIGHNAVKFAVPTSILFTLLYMGSDKISFGKVLNNIIETLGGMTYATYLIHFPLQIIIILIYSYLNIAIPFYSYFLFYLYISLTFFLSYFIYIYFEMPMQNYLRRRMLPRK